MSAYSRDTLKYKSKKQTSSTDKKTTKGGNGGKTKNGKSNSNKQSEFEKWLEKLFDWIEVRLDRIQRRIDLATAKAETEIGDKEGTTGTISSRKNEHLDTAMKNIAASASEFQDTNVKVGKNGQVTGFTGKATSNTLLGDSVRGALRYQQQANKVAQKAYKSGIFGKDKKKMNDIIARIQNGTIDISEYNEKIRKFIDSYKEWYDKSQDLVQSTNELKKQYNDLQQQKLDNITEEYETLIDLYDAQKTTSESMIKYYQTYGQQVNSGDKYQLTRQRNIQNTTLSKLYEEQKKYQAELNNSRNVFGANSNEYRAAQKVLEEINNNIYEAKTGILETNHQIAELAFTVRDFAINRLKTLVEKLATIASLSEKRGTNTKLGYQVTEGIYTQQIGINQDLIKKYQEQISKKKTDIENRIKNEGLRKDSQAYEDETKKISDWENQILSLLSANEDLRTSMRNLRWKGYTQLREELDNIKSDFEHIQSLIRDGEILDSDGALTERGYAKVALIGEEMLIAEKNISNAKEAMKKLKEEVDNGVISQETYNEEINTQIDLIQDNAKAVQDYQEALAKIKIDQMEKQNDALQDLIKARKDALNAKKEYYDWDKNLKSKNKDIAQLQAQINALNGVTNDAANARRAKLQAELAEKQEDLQDTLYEHSIEIQQEGYDKLSEDMQEALDKAIDLINGKQDALQDTADQMLAQLKTNTVDEKAIIDGIVQDRATAIHEETKKAINETLINGNETLADELGVGTTNTVGENIENISPNSAVTNIDTSLADYYAKESQQSAESESSNQDAIQAVIDNNNNISSLEKKADAAYEADLKVANEVANLINQLKSNSSITLASKSAVSTAQSKWNALTDNQKAILQQKDTYKSLSSKLTGASNTIKQLQDLKATTNMTLAQAKKAKEEADLKEARDKEIKKLKDTIDSYKKSINTITEEIKKLKKKKQTAKIKQQIDQKRNTREDYKSKLEYTRQTLKSKYGISYAKGSKRIPEDLLAWTNEDWDKYGSEIIVRPEDNAILTPLKANDSVIPANLADNLFKWGAISPDKFITNPFVGKWSSDGKGGSSITTDDSYIGGQTIEMHFDSLFHIEGNVDESVMPRLENLGKSLVNDRDFQKNVIKFVTKDFVRESKKQGIR